MRLDQLCGRQRQPLVQRHILESGRSEQLKKFQRAISGVLNVMAHRFRDVAYIACAEVKGAGGILRGEYRHPARSGQIVLPFVCVRMPVDLPHRFGRHLNNRCRDFRRDRKIARIRNFGKRAVRKRQQEFAAIRTQSLSVVSPPGNTGGGSEPTLSVDGGTSTSGFSASLAGSRGPISVLPLVALIGSDISAAPAVRL